MADLSNIDTSLVTVGQPTDGGCVYIAIGEDVAVPTDATTKMSTLTAFKSAGTISENGFTLAKSVTTSKFKDWGGNVVLSMATEEENTFKLEFAEPNRPVVAQLKYGSGNVEAGADGSVAHIKAVVGTSEKVAIVIDELECNGFLRRTVVPCAMIDSFDDETHQKGSLLVYGMTFTAVKAKDTLFDIYRAKPAEQKAAQAVATGGK